MFKQPRVPEYRENEGVAKHLKALTLFLKDFCMDAWKESHLTAEKISSFSVDTFLGVNIISNPDDDTTVSWREIGTGYGYFCTAGLLAGQPDTWGMLLNLAYGEDVFQIWNTQPGGATFFRSGNGRGWNDGWRKAFDSRYRPSASEVGALAAGGTAVNSEKLSGKTWAQVLGAIYPVGAIYISTSSTSPAALFGGTWEQICGRFLLGMGANEANNTDYWGGMAANAICCPDGEMGGEAYHTLTVNEMPNHYHQTAKAETTTDSGAPYFDQYNTYQSEWRIDPGYYWYAATLAAGGNGAHNNMPPYLAVFMWKRVG